MSAHVDNPVVAARILFRHGARYPNKAELAAFGEDNEIRTQWHAGDKRLYDDDNNLSDVGRKQMETIGSFFGGEYAQLLGNESLRWESSPAERCDETLADKGLPDKPLLFVRDERLPQVLHAGLRDDAGTLLYHSHWLPDAAAPSDCQGIAFWKDAACHAVLKFLHALIHEEIQDGTNEWRLTAVALYEASTNGARAPINGSTSSDTNAWRVCIDCVMSEFLTNAVVRRALAGADDAQRSIDACSSSNGHSYVIGVGVAQDRLIPLRPWAADDLRRRQDERHGDASEFRWRSRGVGVAGSGYASGSR